MISPMLLLSAVPMTFASFQEGQGEFSSIAEGVNYVSIRNNTNDSFRCTFRSGAWSSGGVLFTPARQVDQQLVGDSISLQCDGNVGMTYTNLRPGQRYNFLREPDGRVALYNVTPSR